MKVIIIDDEKEITDSYGMFLKRSGVTDYCAYNDPREFIKESGSVRPSIVFLDLQMPYHTGEEVLEIIKSKYPEASVIILTGSAEIEPAVRCMQKGALDYIVKPIDKDRFTAAYATAVKAYEMQTEINALRSAFHGSDTAMRAEFHGIISNDSRMNELFRYVEAVAKSSFPVLITGETGVGKELFANAVHKSSGRKGQFIAVNVSGLDDTMFSDTLFGHIKGAFTGADKPRRGLLAEAEGGTLFLDEIGDLNESTQIKLLRLLQEKKFLPLGSDKISTADVRIVAATNANLNDKIAAGLFRQDLMFRLSTHRIDIPPLRLRKDDIPVLAEIFYRDALSELGTENAQELTRFVINILRKYHFPGNIRQLQAVMGDMAAVFCGRKIKDNEAVNFLKRHGIDYNSECGNESSQYTYCGCFPTLKEMEKHLVESAIETADGNISMAAKLLGITRQALHKRIKP